MGAVSPAPEESKLAATIAQLETMLETTLETRGGAALPVEGLQSCSKANMMLLMQQLKRSED